jgi:hypothetical protein
MLQIEERRKGNKLYRCRNFNEAMAHYEKALSIVQLVKGLRL